MRKANENAKGNGMKRLSGLGAAARAAWGKWLWVGAAVVVWAAASIGAAGAAPAPEGELQALRERIGRLDEELQALRQRLDQTEREQVRLVEHNRKDDEQVKELDQRLSKAERHTATDKLAWNLELRTAVNSLHESGLTASPELMRAFFTPVSLIVNQPVGLSGANVEQLRQGLARLGAEGALEPADSETDNNIIYATRLRLGLTAKYDEHLSFVGRLSAYKVWGDGTGVQTYGGSMGDIAYDGTSSVRPRDDVIRLERAYFQYSQSVRGLPVTFSAGRRPSTFGPPLELGDNSLEGGSTHAALVNWEMDGASLGFGLEELLDIPGAYLKFCYGLGFESQWGNSRSLTHAPDLEDVHMLGVIATLYEGEEDKLEVMYAHAWDVTDGFTGLTVMPFTVTRTGEGAGATYTFAENSGHYISRLEPTTNIGDWDGLSAIYKRRFGDNLQVFVNPAWSHTHGRALSKEPFYELLGQGLLSSNGELSDRDGWLVFVGGRYDIPSIGAKLGLEYNHGSKYWLNFTGGEDSLEASKLATRGHVLEPYWIQQILGDNFFLKLGAQFYWYEYTGSGMPLGEPVRMEDATGLDALNGVLDRLTVYYLSATARF